MLHIRLFLIRSPQKFIGLSVEPVEKDWTIDRETNGTDVTYKIDSGAKAFVIPLRNLQRFRKSVNIHKSSAHLSAYNGTTVKVVAKCILYVRHKGKSYPVLFHVAETKSTSILGLKNSFISI